MWNEDDHFGRWVQFFCALPLLLIAAGLIYFEITSPYRGYSLYSRKNPFISHVGGAILCLCLASRCLWYAITGKNNVNRDDF